MYLYQGNEAKTTAFMISNVALYSPEKSHNNQLMAAECLDDTISSNFSFDFLTWHYSPNQMIYNLS